MGLGHFIVGVCMFFGVAVLKEHFENRMAK